MGGRKQSRAQAKSIQAFDMEDNATPGTAGVGKKRPLNRIGSAKVQYQG